MNGHPMTRARAPVEVPIFVQVADRKGALLEQYWQDCERCADRQLEALEAEKVGDEKGGSKRRSRRVLRPKSRT